MTDFSVYLTYIGNDNYQMFIKNESFDSDFIRIIIGYTEMLSGKRIGKVGRRWIIAPLKPNSEQVFLQQVSKVTVRGKRLWVAFEAVKRAKPSNRTLRSFVALSPPAGKWLQTIGSNTHLKVQMVTKTPRGHIEELIRPSKASAGSSILLRGALPYRV